MLPTSFRLQLVIPAFGLAFGAQYKVAYHLPLYFFHLSFCAHRKELGACSSFMNVAQSSLACRSVLPQRSELNGNIAGQVPFGMPTDRYGWNTVYRFELLTLPYQPPWVSYFAPCDEKVSSHTFFFH
jgi:hypothetical protein